MKGDYPAVSFLMPVRNEGRFLLTALRSLAAQTLKEWELMAVDDGSTDDTRISGEYCMALLSLQQTR